MLIPSRLVVWHEQLHKTTHSMITSVRHCSASSSLLSRKQCIGSIVCAVKTPSPFPLAEGYHASIHVCCAGYTSCTATALLEAWEGAVREGATLGDMKEQGSCQDFLFSLTKLSKGFVRYSHTIK